MSSEDVRFTFGLLQDPNVISNFSDLLTVDGQFPEVLLEDENTIKLIFPRPTGTGLRSLDSLAILPKAHLLGAQKDGEIASIWAVSVSPSDLIGMGPFRLREYRPGVKVVLERNPYYWKTDKKGQRLPYLDTITFLIIPDKNTEALRFESGEIDIILHALDPENYAALYRNQDGSNYRVVDLGSGLDVDYLWFNLNPNSDPEGRPFVHPLKRKVLESAEFRRAVSFAIDREGIAEAVFLGLGTPQYGPVSRANTTWYDSETEETSHDLAKARAMLTQIGLTDRDRDGFVEGFDQRPFRITLSTSKGHTNREKIAQIIKENLSQVGIRVTTQFLDRQHLISRITNTFDYEAILGGFRVTDIEPDLYTDFWLSSGPSHFWHPNQPEPATSWEREMDGLIKQLTQTSNRERRGALFQQFQRIWSREMPAVATVSPNILLAWKSRVRNVRPSLLAPHLLWNVDELDVGEPTIVPDQ